MNLFERWIGSYAVPTEGLALFRILYASYALLFGVPIFGWIGEVPAALFNPPRYSLGAFFESAPSAIVLSVLSVAAVALFVALLFGYRTRIVSLLLAAFLIVGLTSGYSFGKIDHGRVFLTWVPLVMAFSPWGQAFSLDAVRRGLPRGDHRISWSNAWPVALMALLVGFAYFSAGLPKSLVWVDFDLSTQGARSWLVRGFQAGRQNWLASAFFHNNNALMWEAMDLTAVFFEVGFLLSVLKKQVFRVFVASAVFFHAANVFMLNINFTSLAYVYAVFLPWDRILAGRWGMRLRAAASAFASRGLLLGVLAASVGLVFYSLSQDAMFSGLLTSTLEPLLPDQIGGPLLLAFHISFGVVVAALLLYSVIDDVRAARRDRFSADMAPTSTPHTN